MDTERKLNGWTVQMRTSRKISFHGTEHDVRSSKGRASLDAAMLRVVRLPRKKSAWGLRTLVLEHTNYYRSGAYYRYDRNMKVLQESVDRLVVAGKILPVTEKGHLIPCH